MNPEALARIKFAVTIGFHFIFVPISIGLVYHLCYMELKAHRSGDATWRRIADIFKKLMLLTFVLGVATGLTMVFQFGTDWSRYSVFVGDVFGGMLAAEAIFAFFLESVFMGIYLFGGDRISGRTRVFSVFMVALGTTLSAFWILVANSWQQTPDGYAVIVEDGMRKAVMTDFWAAVFNPSFVNRFTHQMMACLAAGAFVVTGVGAWWALKHGGRNPVARKTLTLGLVSGLVFSLLVMFPTGHHSAVGVAETQLEKFAAMEGIFETEKGAGLTILGLPVGDPPENSAVLAIPRMLSIMAYGDVHAEVKGLNDFPKEDRPPVLETFIAFHLMVGLGMLLFGAAALGVFMLWRGRLFDTGDRWVRLFLLALVLCSPLPVLANELGWMTAEVGRQPWVVYERPDPSFDPPAVPGERAEIRRLPGMRTDEAYTVTVDARAMLFSLVAFTLLYIALTWLWASQMLKTVRCADVRAAETAVGEDNKQEARK